jgi:hypothetical protein
MIEIHWTDAGRRHAANHNLTTETIEAMARSAADREGFSPTTLIGHVIEADPQNDEAIFVLSPSADGTAFVIDGAKWERTQVVEEGPFKGRALMMPAPMTGSDA